MRWIGWSIAALMLVSVLLVSVGVGLVATEAGSRWLVAKVLSFTGAPIAIEGLNGALLTTVRAARVRYTSATVQLSARDIAIDPTWLTMLWSDRVTITRLIVGSLDVTTTPSERSDDRPPTLPPLPVVLDVTSAELRELRVNAVAAEWLPSLTAAVRWDRSALTVRELHASAARYALDGEVTATVDGALEIDAKFHGDVNAPGADGETTYRGAVTITGPADALRIEGSLDAPWPIELDGVVQPFRDEPLFAIDVSGRDLEWQGYRVATMDARVSGTRLSYGGRMNAHVTTPDAIEGDVRAEFVGDKESVRIDDAEVLSSVGAVKGTARVVWSPAVSAEFAAAIRDADAKRWVPDIPSHIGASVAGRYVDNVLTVAIDDVHGEIAARPITGRGALRMQGGEIAIDSVEITSGEDRAAGSGRWREDALLLTATFSVRDLASFFPDVAGDVSGSIEAARNAAEWSGKANVTSRRLRYSGAEMKDVRVAAERTLEGRSRARARAAAVTSGEIELTGVVVNASGPDDALNVRITADAPSGSSTVEATLAIARGAVSAEVAQGAVLALPGGTWQLDATTKVEAGSGRVQLSAHCWRAREGELCVEGLNWQGDRIDSKGRLVGLPVATIAWVDPALEDIRGTIEGQWTIERRGTEWRGGADLGTVGLRYDPEVEHEGDEVALPPLSATLSLRESGGTVELEVGAQESQRLTARVRTRGYEADAPLEGRIDIAIEDLTRIQTLSERASKTKGRIEGSLIVGGTLRAPMLTGRIRLADGALEWQEPYLDLSRIELELALTGDGRIAIEGSARSRGSNLRVNGAVTNAFASTRRLALSLSSDPVTVAIPDMEVTMVPALDLRWTDNETSLTGAIRVPTASIKVSRLPEGATARSEDVIVAGREAEIEPGTNVEADVRVELGDDVRLSAFGVDTRLTGSLRLRQEKHKQLQLFGRINLVGGNYSAYGRTLAIESGRLLFQGPPDDPDVDVRAVRKIERPEPEQPVTVGVHVRGHAKALESTLFSEPAMAESDALSYLVMGRPLRQTTENEGQDLSGIAMALGLAQATGIVNQIRTRIGLDELGAGTSAAQETTVVAGKQVASKLYARYTYNTFTRLSALLLRYDLTRKLSLEATAGEAPGMDVIYRVGSE